MTSILLKMEDDPNICKMEDSLNFWKMEEEINCKINGGQPQLKMSPNFVLIANQT